MITDEKLRLTLVDESGGAPSDRDFDRLYPSHVRELSAAFWTPVQVARRTAALLDVAGGTRVLDVGAGVGKFCIVAALASGADVCGIEHREDLVRIANAAAERLRAPTRFVHGSVVDVDWTEFDAFYFYNPFFENVHRDNHIDESVELSARKFEADVQVVIDALARAPIGTRVVTYHGLGGPLPPAYRLVSKEAAGSDLLELWVNAGEPTGTDPDDGASRVPEAPRSGVRGVALATARGVARAL